jgi:hypothetical protein
MFAAVNQGHDKMQALQVVDSEFVLNLLRSDVSLDIEILFAAYKLSGNSPAAKHAQGYYFEEVIHQWILIRKPHPVTTACRFAEGTKEVPQMLTERNLYWIPVVSNFPNIDSALVHEDTLYAFQFSVGGGHTFNESTFRRGFVDVVRSNRAFQNVELSVVVCFVTNTQAFKAPSSSFPSRTFCVDMTSVQTMAAAIEGMMSDIAGGGSGFRRIRQLLCRKRRRRPPSRHAGP